MSPPTPRSAPRVVELKFAGANLAQGREALHAALGLHGDALIAFDLDGRIVDMNGAAERLTGWRSDEAKGKALEEIYVVIGGAGASPYAPASVDRAPGTPRAMESATLPATLPATLIDRAGQRRSILHGRGPLHAADGRRLGAVVLFCEAPEGERRRDPAPASSDDFRRVIEDSPDGVAICSRGRVAFANRAFAAALGYPDAATLRERPLLDLLRADERGVVEEAMARAGDRDGEGATAKETLEIHGVRADGEPLALELSPPRRIRFAGGEAVLLALRERRNTEARLELPDRMVTVGTLAASLAHQLSNPLASVVTNLDVALDELRRLAGSPPESGGATRSTSSVSTPDEAIGDPLRDALESSERLRAVVHGLRSLSRSEENPRAEVDLRRVLDSSLRLAWREIIPRARVVKELCDVPPVEGSEGHLVQVFLNLLVNAAQAIPEGEPARHEIRLVTGTDGRGRAFAEVYDTGEGISTSVRRRIFEPFFTTRRRGLGAGLGLPICREIVGAHGGAIDVESAVGKGSRFRVTLPSAAGRETSDRAVTPVPAKKRRARVLAVDDEPAIGALIRRVLGSLHDVELAGDAHEALARLATGARFDLILCDLMMPGLTGIELYQRLERDLPEQARRLVFLTGGAFTPEATAFLERGSLRRIEKPFSVGELRALVEEQLR